MARQAVLPSNPNDPTGQSSRENRAIKDFERRLSVIQKGVLRILDKQNYTVVTLNSRHLEINEVVYRFELDETILANINAEIALLVDTILLEGGLNDLWFMSAYVQGAVQQGTAQSWTNLTVQSEAYAAARPTLESILLSPPYQKRLGLVRAREFELMAGFSDQTKGDLARTLTEGMGLGKNPREIAKDIRARIGVSESRSARIARTEITNALRQARMAETDQAREDLGIRTLELHISALSPSTRKTHAARHGTLHSTQEQREWWSRDANSIQCKCSTVSVLIGDDGEPLTPSIIERAKRMKK